MDAQEAIERGIAAARAGNQRTAYYYFYSATRADPSDEQAWLWRASAAPRPEEALNCLAAVLSINPTNPVAQHGLEQISAALAATRDAEGVSITPSLTSEEGHYQPPEHRLEWQQIFQRDHYDAGRVAHLEAPAAEEAPPDAPTPPSTVVPVGDRPPLAERVGDSVNGLRRMLVERNALRRQIALISVIPVALLMLLVFWFAAVKFPVTGTSLPPPSGPTATPLVVAPTTPPGPEPPTATLAPVVNPPADTPPAPTQPPATNPTAPPVENTPVPPTLAAQPPTSVPATPAPPPPSGERTHTVAAGETLQTVATQAGVSLAALMVHNGITNPADVHEGQTIKIPDPNSADAHPTEVHHVVRPGENMTTIARLYGVTPEAISARNGITDPNHIFAGQELIVPLK